MATLAQAEERGGIPKVHQQPLRPGPEKLLEDVLKAYRCTPDALRDRTHQGAFRAWVYLLRRAGNLSLREVAGRAGVSPARISQIQGEMEAVPVPAALESLIARYKVKA